MHKAPGHRGIAPSMTNPAIHPRPNGDVDIELPEDDRSELEVEGTAGGQAPEQEASVRPENLDHPEELMGE
jgi:hypothetical protein